MKQHNEYHATWTRYKVLSKRLWQRYAKPDNSGLKHKWVAESEDKAMLEAMKKLIEET